MPEATPNPQARVRSRLTPLLAAVAGGALLVHVVAAAIVLGAVWHGQGIGDWVAFYAAGTMARTGDAARLYDTGAQAALQHSLFGNDVRTFAFPQPAFLAYALAPLSRLSFGASFFVWTTLNIAVTAALGRSAWRHLSGVPLGPRAAFVACAAVSTPVVDTLLLGQLDLLVLASIAGCYALLRRDRPVAAGLALAPALVKPQVVVAIVLLLAVKREWRALGGLAAAGAPLLLAPVPALGPGILLDQARLIASLPGASTDQAVMAGMMINVRGAIVSVTGASSPWLWAPPLSAIAAASMYAAVGAWRVRPAADAQSWAIALMLPLICSPHVHLQTMVLLLGAAALYVRAMSEAGRELRIEPVLTAYSGIAALWLLSVAGVSLMFAPLLLAFAAVVRRWPEPDEAAMAERQPTARAA